jgi:hypothetical protein
MQESIQECLADVESGITRLTMIQDGAGEICSTRL